MNITSELSKKIEAALEAYVSNPEPELLSFDPPLDLRKLAGELNLLPLLLDMGGCIGVRPDGALFAFVWDDPYELMPETDTRVCNIALFNGAQKFPEMMELIPMRPANARECDYCKGSGVVVGLPPDLAKAVRCYCGGLGWVP
jgi:hypothetical protein